jgi:hypothetical protein
MPLNNASYILEKIKNSQDDVPQFDQLYCWEKSLKEYKIYVFSIQIAKESDLIDVNDKLRDFIAIYFQSQLLEKMVEKWNIYQVIIVNEKVAPQIKQRIEQDKFATRKIVFSDFPEKLNEVEVNKLISDEIFSFTITPTKTDIISLKDSISDEDKEVINLISEYKTLDIKGNIDVIVARLNNE